MKRVILSIALLSISAGLIACDTVAELTFQEEQVIEAIPQGLIAKQCGAFDSEKTDAIFRFSVLTSLDAHLTPGRRYAALNDVLDPGRNFNASDVTFSDGWVFVVDKSGADMTCSSAEDCPAGAACVTPDEMGLSSYYYAPVRVCAYSTQIEAVSVPRFTHFRTKVVDGNDNVLSSNTDGRTFAFVIDNSSSLDGSSSSGVPNADEATDPWQYRKVGLNQFIDGLSMTDETSPRYEFSAHFANGMGATGVYDASVAWMKTVAVWNSTVMGQYPNPSGYSPIWETASASLNKMLDNASASYSKMMIAMTDGEPNDNTDEAWEAFYRSLQMTSMMPVHWLELTSGNVHRRYADAVNMGCGSHYIFDNPVFFSKIMRNIAMNSESHWDVDLHFSANLPSEQTYRLATVFVAKIGNSAVTFEAQRMNEQNEAIDYRLVFSK